MSRGLNDVEWKEFNIIEILGKAHNSKAYHNNNLIPDKYGIPYITRTNFNNGLYDTVKNINNLIINPSNTITLGAENATYFTQPFNYITGNKMYYYQSKGLSLNALKFITICLNKSLVGGGFGYGLGLTGTRSDKRKFMLPINSKGEPDYEFMEEYIKEKETKLKQEYKTYIQNRVAQLQKKVDIQNKEWNDFKLEDIFTNMQQGKSKGLNHLKVDYSINKDNVSYLGATNRNNGVLSFVDSVNEKNKIQKGNCIAFIRNGEGSMGYSIYKQEDFISTSDITIGYNNYLDRYVGTFITTIADRVRGKYSFNYKRSDTRLKKETISLPINSKNEPDYEFMHDYMLYLEQKKILEYLDYIDE